MQSGFFRKVLDKKAVSKGHKKWPFTRQPLFFPIKFTFAYYSRCKGAVQKGKSPLKNKKS